MHALPRAAGINIVAIVLGIIRCIFLARALVTPSLKRFCNRTAKLLDVVTNITDSHEAEFVVMNLMNNEK